MTESVLMPDDVAKEVRASIKKSFVGYQQILTGEVKFFLTKEEHKDRKWREVMILPKWSNQTIDFFMS